MKSIRYRLLIATMAVLLGSAIARSQTTDAPPAPPMHGHHAGMQGHEMGFFAKQLNLTDEQKTQMKTIMESAHTTMKPLRQQSHQIDQQLHQYAMGKSMGKDEEGAVQQLASQPGRTGLGCDLQRTTAAFGRNPDGPVPCPGGFPSPR